MSRLPKLLVSDLPESKELIQIIPKKNYITINQALKTTDAKKIVLQKLKQKQPKRLFKLPTLGKLEVKEVNNELNSNTERDRQSMDLNGISIRKQDETKGKKSPKANDNKLYFNIMVEKKELEN